MAKLSSSLSVIFLIVRMVKIHVIYILPQQKNQEKMSSRAEVEQYRSDRNQFIK